jgi:hypothetical protein
VSWPRAGFFAQINFFVDLDPTRELTDVTTFIPNGPPELVAAVQRDRTVTSTLYGFSAFDGSCAVRMDAHLAQGVPVREIGIGT